MTRFTTLSLPDAPRSEPDAIEQLLELDRFASLGNLSPHLGHEINNLASVLSGVIFMLRDACDEKRSPGTEEVAELEQLLERLAFLGRSLNQVGRSRPSSVETLDLRAEVARAIEMLGSFGCTRLVRIELGSGGQDLRVAASRTRVLQLVMDLIMEEIQAVAGGHPHHALQLSVTRDADQACLQISHDVLPEAGAGVDARLDPGDLGRSFTTTATLGLMSMQTIALECGGTLEVAACTDGTQLVELRLPLELNVQASATRRSVQPALDAGGVPALH